MHYAWIPSQAGAGGVPHSWYLCVTYPAGVVPDAALPDSAASIPQQRPSLVVDGHRVGALPVLVLLEGTNEHKQEKRGRHNTEQHAYIIQAAEKGERDVHLSSEKVASVGRDEA